MKNINSKKVLLVQSYLGGKEPPVYPIGIAYIAACLNLHDVKILDLNVIEDPYTELSETINSFQPDVVGVSLRNIDSQQRLALYYYYKDFELFVKNIKAVKADITLVAGGAGFSMFAEEIMKRNPALDFGIYLEGEETLPDLLEHIDNPETVHGIFYRQNGIVCFTGKRAFLDFSKLPPPRRDLLDISKYLSNPESIGIQTKRGCILKCAYCNYPMLNGATMRLRQPEHIVDEIEELVNVSGVRQFMFADSVFNLPLKHAKDICREILRRDIKANWSAWLDIRYIDEEFLLLAAKAGCNSVAFSPDAVSQKALTALKKGIKEKDIWNTLSLFTQKKELKGVNVTFSAFINPPGEELKGLFKTILFYIRAKLMLKGRGGAFLNWIRIEPDTEVYKIALKEGIINERTNLLPDNERALQNLFYSCPSLRYFDHVMFVFLKFISLFKRLLGRGK